MVLAATLNAYCWTGDVADRDVCYDGCVDRAGDETEAFIRPTIMHRVRKIAAENSDGIFGLEKSINESTKRDENMRACCTISPDFLLRITATVDIKQPLQSGCGHKMGNKIVATNVVVFFHSCLRWRVGRENVSLTNLFIRERAFSFVASSENSQEALLRILVARSCDDCIDWINWQSLQKPLLLLPLPPRKYITIGLPSHLITRKAIYKVVQIWPGLICV